MNVNLIYPNFKNYLDISHQDDELKQDELKKADEIFKIIPQPIFTKIFQYLDLVSICRLGRVSKKVRTYTQPIWEERFDAFLQTIGQRLIEQNQKIMQLMSKGPMDPHLNSYIKHAKGNALLENYLIFDNLQTLNQNIPNILECTDTNNKWLLFVHYYCNYTLLSSDPSISSQSLSQQKLVVLPELNSSKEVFSRIFQTTVNFSGQLWKKHFPPQLGEPLQVSPLLEDYKRLTFQDQAINHLFFKKIYLKIKASTSYKTTERPQKFLKFCQLVHYVLEGNLERTIPAVCQLPRTKEQIAPVIPLLEVTKNRHKKQILFSELEQVEKFTVNRFWDLNQFHLSPELSARSQAFCLKTILQKHSVALAMVKSLADYIQNSDVEDRFYLARFITQEVGTLITSEIEAFDLPLEGQRLEIYTLALHKGDTTQNYSISKMWQAIERFNLTSLTQNQVLEFSKQIFGKGETGNKYKQYFQFQKESPFRLDVEHQIKLIDFLISHCASSLLNHLLDFKLHLDDEDYESWLFSVFMKLVHSDSPVKDFQLRLEKLLPLAFEHNQLAQNAIIQEIQVDKHHCKTGFNERSVKSARSAILEKNEENSDLFVCGKKREFLSQDRADTKRTR